MVPPPVSLHASDNNAVPGRRPGMRGCDPGHLNVSTTIGGMLEIAHRRCDSALAERFAPGSARNPTSARADETVPSRRHGRPPPLPPAPGWRGPCTWWPRQSPASANWVGLPYAPAAKCARQSGGEPVTDRGEAGAREPRAATAGACVLVVEDDDGN